jgi:hypothetical protein
MSQLNADATSVGGPASTERLAWSYSQLRQIEAHWTQQVQNQQARITTTLTVNGIILAFLAGSGLLTKDSTHHGPPADLLVASLCLLTLGLVAGLASLLPLNQVGGTSWRTLNAEQKRNECQMQRKEDETVAEFISVSFLGDECGEVAIDDQEQPGNISTTALLTILIKSFSTRSLRKTIRWRRRCLWAQLVALMGAVVILTIALSVLVLGT